MLRAATTLFAVSLLTSGCSYSYEIVAVEEGGSIVFKPKAEQGTGCFSDFAVTAANGVIVWKVSVDRYLSRPCRNQFPIAYGVKPVGMTETVKPTPLQPGILYRVEGWDGDSYSGSFRFKQGIIIENVTSQR